MPDVNDEGAPRADQVSGRLRHLTCGRASCSKSDARRERDRAWAARQARQLNADCEEEIARRHGARSPEKSPGRTNDAR
ncbi:hypothetical protein ACE103_22050 [Bradyrhizobium sp. ma5]|uniref:hypothetical protein n=1 Tax=Bradyrhizobium sp. ma5 TaxID=3344828 RepID=UPI0035D519EF